MSSDNIFSLVQDYLSICTRHQELICERESNISQFHNDTSQVLIEYLRQIPVSNLRPSQSSTSTTNSIPLRRPTTARTHMTSTTGLYNRRRSTYTTPSSFISRGPLSARPDPTDLPSNTSTRIQTTSSGTPTISSGTPTTNSGTPTTNSGTPTTSQPISPTTQRSRAPVPAMSRYPYTTSAPLTTIPEPLVLPPITRTSGQSSDNGAHNNLDEQTLPSQVLVHSPTSNQTEVIREPTIRTYISSFDSPVRIRPTRYQINDATSLITFSDISGNSSQTRCPIDLIDFSSNDNIMKIDHCGHIFRETNIRMHFRNNTRCPLCRFDIRDHGIEDSIA